LSGTPSRGQAFGEALGGEGTFQWVRRAVILFGLFPFLKLLWDAGTGGLGVEPVEALLRRTGWWALTLLVATLAVTPLRRLSGWNRLITLRKPLGLIAFFYATTHFLVYVGVDQFFGISYILSDILERPFITVGFLAFLLLVPLAATSRREAIRRMGGKRWRRLHRLIYPAALLGVLHYYWLVKADTTRPLLFAALVIVLLGARIVAAPRTSGAAAPRAVSPAGTERSTL
jgi:methionine sulfoxide reductase heme-binding subunit